MIKLKDLSFSYPDGIVLENVNMEIHKGDSIALLGSNGSGKSTLVKLILGLMEPSQGAITRQYHTIAYVPQQGLEDVLFPVSVNELLKFRLAKSKGSQQRIHDALKRVGMQDHGKKLIKQLSGGQRQRVLIARELLVQPDILILDEPTTGLDQESITKLYALLKGLNENENMTIILVTHHLDDDQQENKRIFEVFNHEVKEVNHV